VTRSPSRIAGCCRGILRGAAGNFKRVSLELGGKSANVIFDDADIEAATKAAASGIFFNAGQVVRRVVSYRGSLRRGGRAADATRKAIRIGDPADRATASAGDLRKADEEYFSDYVDIGQTEGAFADHGANVSAIAVFHQPAVFANVEHGMRIFRRRDLRSRGERHRFRDELMRCGSPTHRLQPRRSVWSRDIGRVQRFAKKANAGTVWINTYGYTDVRLPWAACGIPASAANTARRRLTISPSRSGLDEPERLEANASLAIAKVFSPVAENDFTVCRNEIENSC